MKRLAIACLLLLAGCHGMVGVTATPEEVQACKDEGCTVWTEDELKALFEHAWKKGYDAGVKSI